PPAPPPEHAGLTIGWIGSPTTQAHLEHVAPALATFCAERGARVHLIGATKGFTLRGVPVEVVPWSSGGEVAELRRLDLGIMPLPDSPWERGKCGFKLIQYMGCSLPVIASPVGVNAEIVVHGETGLLATGEEEWLAALRTLGGSAALRARMGAAGRARLEARYTLQAVAPRLIGLLRGAAAARGPRSTAQGAPRPPRSIAGNTALNLAGMLAPLAAALLAIPHLNRFLGTERLGFLTLAWALIGYVSLLDLGIGRALTKLVAELLGSPDEPRLARLIWTALAIMLGLGVLAGLGLAAGAQWLVASALQIPPALQPEAVAAVRVLALTVPLVVTSAGFRGVLEAQGRFGISNAVRTPLGVWLIASPLLLWPLGTRSLAAVAALLFAGRLAAWVAYGVACVRAMPALLPGFALDRRQVGPLLRFGGWMTVSSVISPLMIYMDRFLLGHRASLQVVAWYTMPFEVVTKILVLPGAVVTVLFPLFSALTAQGSAESGRLYRLGLRYVPLAMFVPVFAASLFAREGLGLWLGPEFAEAAQHVVQLIALGCLFNGIATVPFALLQGAGRPDVTAKIHLLELPVYVALVVGLTLRFGITGTALAWALRMGLDLVALLLLARGAAEREGHPARPGLAAAALATAVFATSLLPLPPAAKAALLAVVVVAEASLIWRVLLDRDGLGHVKRQLLGLLRLPTEEGR
ncbi:MAG TPA: oligosaccharide flippase family protein, partial [Anaeromyxobacteraceae bacterium]|nr:oligosaccharide flippase family protein [Anaeromyxobacteraceae bacterium]